MASIELPITVEVVAIVEPIMESMYQKKHPKQVFWDLFAIVKSTMESMCQKKFRT